MEALQVVLPSITADPASLLSSVMNLDELVSRRLSDNRQENQRSNRQLNDIIRHRGRFRVGPSLHDDYSGVVALLPEAAPMC